MKRIISILLAVLMLTGLLGTFAFADTSQAVFIPSGNYRIELYSNYYHMNYYYAGGSNNRYIITGQINEGIKVSHPGTYYIDIYDLEVTSPSDYYALEICDNATLYITAHGVNGFYGYGTSAIVGNNSKVVFDVADNSSVKFDVYGEQSVFNSACTLEMKDGSAVAATEVDGWENNALEISNGTAVAGNSTYTYLNDNVCVWNYNGNEIANMSHKTDYEQKNNGHQKYCVLCDHDIGTVEEHDIYYYADEGKCVPYCIYCGYEYEPTEHVFKNYEIYDEEHCINYCSNCGYADEEVNVIPHELIERTYEATKFEAAKTTKNCKVCGYYFAEYQKENNIYLELSSSNMYEWEENNIVIYVNGEPATLVRSHTGCKEAYAMPFDENASYSFRWIEDNEWEGDSVKIYLPDQAEPVYENDDLNELDLFEEFFDINTADYSELYDRLDRVPESLEYYTKASVDKLVLALRDVKKMLASSKQAEVDKMAEAVRNAVDGLVETDQPTTLGVINLGYSEVCINSADFENKGYSIDGEFFEYDGDYTIIQSDYSRVPGSITIGDGDVNVTVIGLTAHAENSCVYATDEANVKLTALGRNVLLSDYGSAICVGGDAKLTIEKTDGSIFALGGEDAAGIGNSEEENCGEIAVNGGTVFALSDGDGAGIGSGRYGELKKITVNGGRIHAECLSDDGSGIGVGDNGNGGDIIINGGDITALSLDDGGSGIGGASEGSIDSITINGGNIVAGSSNGAAIGGGEDDQSYAGRVTINGGVIRAHPVHEVSDSLIGNGSVDSEGESEYNFVQINGGAIFDDYTKKTVPAPKNKDGKLVVNKAFNVHESYRDKEITLVLSDGTEKTATAIGTAVRIYIPKGIRIKNESALQKEPVDIKDSSKLFYDVVENAWYKQYVDYAVSHGIFSGTGKNKFSPDLDMTRAQFVQVLANVSGVKLDNNVNTGFTDAPSGKWFSGAVKWAAESGVASGTGNGKFDPTGKIDRQQMCVMLVNYVEKYRKAELDKIKTAEKFADDKDIATWAKTAVYKCADAELVNGTGNNRFSPKVVANRATGATIFTKFHQDYIW